MCGRYVLVSSIRAIEKELQADFQFTYEPCYNAFPSKEMPVILSSNPLAIENVKWGLVPSWSKWQDVNYFYNAFISDIVKHSAYKIPIRKRRCLVPVNCFYVWIRQEEKGKQPFVVYLKDQRIFTLAGVYDIRKDRDTGRIFYSFAIITTFSNKRLSKFLPTMPAIIPPSRRNKYLKENLTLQEVMRMLKPFETEQINLYPVSKKVNDPMNNLREIVMPIGDRLFQEYTQFKGSSKFEEV